MRKPVFSRFAHFCIRPPVAILVSHHHSIVDFAVPPLLLLPEIRKAAGGGLPRSGRLRIGTGADAFKALALGANGVCSARAATKGLAGGQEVFAAFIRETTGELRHFLNRTGSPDIRHIDPGVIHSFGF